MSTATVFTALVAWCLVTVGLIHVAGWLAVRQVNKDGYIHRQRQLDRAREGAQVVTAIASGIVFVATIYVAISH